MEHGAELQRMETVGHPEASLDEAGPWWTWGPYLSERAWGTVREDYSADGDAWSFFPHDHARSRVYRWNEDGMAGFCDEAQNWCLALALWNGVDPILKERMFGLAGPQGNHGEDVKEYWWYLDATPTPLLDDLALPLPAARVPVRRPASRENASRGRTTPSTSCVDTGVFDEDRYWVVDGRPTPRPAPTDLCLRITRRRNAGPEAATLHVLPTLWFRNTWSWGCATDDPEIRGATAATAHRRRALARWAVPARRRAAADGEPPSRCSATTRPTRSGSSGARHATPYPKDGINDHVVHGAATVNPSRPGTKAALWYRARRCRPAADAVELRLRLWSPSDGDPHARPLVRGRRSTRCIAGRQAEADEFYADARSRRTASRARRRARQAFAGLIWGKQFYHYDVPRWLDGDPDRRPRRRHAARAQRRLAALQRLRRHLDAGPVGVPLVRRVGPRLPRRAARAHRPGVRQVPAAAAAAASGTCTRTVRCPRTSGPSTTSTRRCTPGRRSRSSEIDGGTTSTSWRGSSTSC